MHSSVSKCLCCFCFLPILNSATVNVCVNIYFNFFENKSRGPIAVSYGHMAKLDLTFEELQNCFPKWLYHFTFPTSSIRGSQFFRSLAFTCYLPSKKFFFCSHPYWSEVVPHCGFIWISLMPNGLVVFPTFFNLSLNLAIRSS